MPPRSRARRRLTAKASRKRATGLEWCDRDRVARAVHRAVCQFSASDGFGLCHAYAVAALGVFIHLGGTAETVTINAGTCA
jgi:hypothetical protein